MTFPPIAIVGRACVLPGALDPGALWERVRDGADLVSRAPRVRWRLRSERLSVEDVPGRDRVATDRGGYVEGFDALFDPSGFAVPAEQLQTLDPVVRWLLHVSHEALREAGVEGGPRVAAVFGNLSFPSAALSRYSERVWLDSAHAAAAGLRPVDARNRFMSGLPVHLVARALRLGPGFALDAACASSLYAVKLACDLLHDHRADVALAGAVSAADDLFIHVGFTALQALSRSGRSRPFHREADGLLPAEGAGAVALKRLGDAEAAGDRIFGVIRGIGLSNDGRSRGLLAPAEEGQERAMRAAYAAAGLRPSDVSLLECHATGTAVGDAAEVRSSARVFEGAADVPIGSLKSNIGHAVTAAGIAGLLKVIGALGAGVRPPTLHVDEPLELLGGTPLRLLREAEKWESSGVRRAAVSAFGFGGANAHLIVEEYVGPVGAAGSCRCGPPSSFPVAKPPEEIAVAVVGIGAAVGVGRTAADFAAALFANVAPAAYRATTIVLPVTGMPFPPNDLASALPQQLWTIAAAREALAGVAMPARGRAAAMVGMGCDPVVARYGARWRLPDFAASWGVTDDAWIRGVADAMAPVLDGPGVLGTMPNLTANRLNVQFDLAGPGFAVSAEELSGVRALQLAVRSLRAGEIDVTLAGAADFSCDPVHEAAARELGLPGPHGDGALVLALKRLDDARRDGDRVLAVIDDVADVSEPGLAAAADDNAFGDAAIAARFGRAHAAFGLVRAAAAVMACAVGRRPGGEPGAGKRSVSLEIGALGGQCVCVRVRAASAEPAALPAAEACAGAVVEYPAHRLSPALPPLPVEPGTLAPAPALMPVLTGEAAHTFAGSVDSPAAATMPHAPTLVTVLESGNRALEGGIPAPLAPASLPPEAASGPRARAVLAQIAEQVAEATRVHRAFLEDQAAAHGRFLEVRERAMAALLAAASNLPQHKQTEAIPTAVVAVAQASAIPVHEAPLALETDLKSAVASTRISPNDASSSGGGVARRGGLHGNGSRNGAVPLPTDITLDRSALETLANGRLSDVFGPAFADLDSLRRRVRMPEPPLLLADRVVRLEAQPLSLGTGTIWTETDVDAEAWYLHEGRVPAGILVEAGQADLLLISWLGVDTLNRGERVYRLLGCELTYHGGLPVAGDTLRYQIGIDGHAQQGPVRLFFFHSECTVGGIPHLTVRDGQAGFFTDEELAASTGVLWDPAFAECRERAQVDPAPVTQGRTRLSRRDLEAFAAGRTDECFGPGFEAAALHTRTPRIQAGRMLLLDEVTEIAAAGGPWGRGYLRAVDRIDPDEWFFDGHFTNDPCMPGTLMLEGCLQAMAVCLAALGFTLDRDGWRFEPVPEQPYRMRCRGQVTPVSRELVYEVFVEELIGGPEPTLYADILCTVDGLKAFHCRRMGLRLVPGWPLDSMRGLLADNADEAVVHGGHIERGGANKGSVASDCGVRFDERSLLACAWGRPSEAFGVAYRAFDGTRRLARLPGPPYQFMSRVTRLEGDMGAMREGSAVEVEYDIPPDAWYFAANGAATMPFAVLLEAALQPCGWLATWAGSPLTTERDLSFRNLDGDGRLLAEVLPGARVLRTRAVLTRISRSAGMLIESFDVECSVEGRPAYQLRTVFGYFPAEALARQVGLPEPAGEREALEAVSAESIDLRGRPERYFSAGARLAAPPLLMLDRVTGVWPSGGPAGLGRYRAETDVDPAAWFFKAHFFQDPVQPGSLGLEAMLQLLQFAMLHGGVAEGRGGAARFEPLAVGESHRWKYRGQVLPRNRRVITLLDLVRIGEDERGPLAVADASLWVDGTRIYEARGLAMRIVRDEEVLDPAVDTWLLDHRPTWTVPALPLMSMVDRLARAAARRVPGTRVIAVEDARALRWVPVDGPLRLATQVVPAGEGVYDVTLLAWRTAANESLSRFEPIATGRVSLALGALVTDLKSVTTIDEISPGTGFVDPVHSPSEGVARRGGLHRRTEGSTTEVRSDRTPQRAREQPGQEDWHAPLVEAGAPEEPWDHPAAAEPAPNPYEAATLFHGPSFQLLRSISTAPGASSAILDAAGGGAPRGLLHEALLDALTHGIPHDRLCDWSREIPADSVAYPHRLASLQLYAPFPVAGEIRCETRFAGFDGDPRFPRFHIQAIAEGAVIASLDLVEVLFPKGPIGSAPPRDRRAFLRDRRFVPGLRLSREREGVTELAESEARASDWLPGTLAGAYRADGDLVAQIAAKEHVAARAEVHPSSVELSVGPIGPGPTVDASAPVALASARYPAEPLTVRSLLVARGAGAVRVRDAGPPALDLAPVRDWWDAYYRIGRWPIEDLYFGLAGRFVRRVRLEDPAGFAALRGRAVLYLANHQVGIESILFSLIASGLSGILTVTLAKIEHRTTWLGNLIRHAFAWPGAHDPGVITYFDRSNREDLPRIIGVLARELASGGKSVMIHVEGTRALTCRAPVLKMSGAFLDMAIATGAPVVPVRFAGGLPVEPLAEKLEYPVGMGAQDILIGVAIQPAELASLPYKERKERVIAAINGLGPAAAEEKPGAPDPEFASAAAAWAARTGASPEHGALFETLRRCAAPGSEISLLLAGARDGHLVLRGDPRGLWLAELARRLFGPRGPGVTIEGGVK